MPSQQFKLMALYALWSCLSSVQATTGHTSLLYEPVSRFSTAIYWLLTVCITAVLLLVRRHRAQVHTSSCAANGLPFQATNPPLSSPHLSASVPATATDEKQPQNLSRKEKRRKFMEERRQRERESRLRRNSARATSCSKGWSGKKGHAHGECYPATQCYPVQWLHPAYGIARPTSTSTHSGYSSVAPPPYNANNSYQKYAREFVEPSAQGLWPHWQPGHHEGHSNSPNRYHGEADWAQSPMAEPPVSGSHTPLSSAQPRSLLKDPQRGSLHGSPMTVSDVALWDTRDLQKVAFDPDADIESGDCKPSLPVAPGCEEANFGTPKPTSPARVVADLSWVDEDCWIQPLSVGARRAETFPAQPIYHAS